MNERKLKSLKTIFNFHVLNFNFCHFHVTLSSALLADAIYGILQVKHTCLISYILVTWPAFELGLLNISLTKHALWNPALAYLTETPTMHTLVKTAGYGNLVTNSLWTLVHAKSSLRRQ